MLYIIIATPMLDVTLLVMSAGKVQTWRSCSSVQGKFNHVTIISKELNFIVKNLYVPYMQFHYICSSPNIKAGLVVTLIATLL